MYFKWGYAFNIPQEIKEVAYLITFNVYGHTYFYDFNKIIDNSENVLIALSICTIDKVFVQIVIMNIKKIK